MSNISIWQLIIIFFIFIIVVLPWLMALFSKKADGKDKIFWFLFSFFFSWIGYLLFRYIVVKKAGDK
ncbi:hypothetical protein [Vibrio caribbeanicus]|uniref:hypothetical protein n=1 Tax=Vibrio caribbeanicus TaxID=701175 RepID=UPI0030DADA62